MLTIGTITGSQITQASIGAEGSSTATPLHLYGLADFLLNDLLQLAACSGRLQWSDPLEALIELPRSERARAFQGVTIRQVAEHSHGLDDSLLEHPPVEADGRLDSSALLNALAMIPRIAPPGTFYSRGLAGPLIAAAVLERRGGRAYRQLLPEWLFTPLGVQCSIETRSDTEGRESPQVRLPMAALLRLLAARFVPALPTGGDESPLYLDAAGWRASTRAFPGVSSRGKGVACGWLSLGSDWYGEDFRGPEGTLSIRFNPSLQYGIVVHVDGTSPPPLANVLPQYPRDDLDSMDLDSMTEVPAMQADAALQRYAGTYKNAASSIVVRAPGDGRLVCSIVDHRAQSHASAAHELDLNPLAGRFEIAGGQLGGASRIEFLSADRSSGPCEYLWNGERVWRRADLAEADGLACAEGGLLAGFDLDLDLELEGVLARC